MPSLLDFLPILMGQGFGPQRLGRIPESSDVTDTTDNVVEYDRVMSTKLAIAYAVGLEAVYRARPARRSLTAVDLACGPGHYTLCLARYLGYEQVTGIDRSAPMVETATRNAVKNGLHEKVMFHSGDAVQLSGIGDNTFDLASMADAAHHLRDLQTVTHVLREMSRITKPDGVVMAMDLARLRTGKLTEKYVVTLGHDYVERGLSNFFDEFRNSMYAAWTVTELRSAVPADTQRFWYQIYPRGLPTLQILLGLPLGRRRPFARPGWKVSDHPLIYDWYRKWEREVGPRWAKQTLNEWKLTRAALFHGACRRVGRSRSLPRPTHLKPHR